MFPTYKEAREWMPKPKVKPVWDDDACDENGIFLKTKKGYRQAIPGSMGLIPIDRRKYKKEGKYWERK